MTLEQYQAEMLQRIRKGDTKAEATLVKTATKTGKEIQDKRNLKHSTVLGFFLGVLV